MIETRKASATPAPSRPCQGSSEVQFVPGATGQHDGLLVNLLSNDRSEPDGTGRHCVILEPYGYRWFRVGGLDYLLRRSVV